MTIERQDSASRLPVDRHVAQVNRNGGGTL